MKAVGPRRLRTTLFSADPAPAAPGRRTLPPAAQYRLPRNGPGRPHGAGRKAQAPRKIGSHLKLFDCVSCDKCVPVCPNDELRFTVRPNCRWCAWSPRSG